MKRFLISPNKNQYKANMHSHTTCSDGKMTPEQHKEAYKARGYSVYAFSDHDKIVDHSDLRDPDFLPLLAAELAVGERSDRHPNHKVCFHFNIIPRDPENYEKIEIKNFDFSVDNINKLIKDIKDKNYFVVANHPNWTLFTEDEYAALQGFDGFELYNCITANFGGALSFTHEIYLHLLKTGVRIYPIGADDCHSHRLPLSHPLNDSFGGFTYILADKLEYGDIINALDKGDCYCSSGPQIKEAYIDGNTVKIKTSDARRITILSETRKTYCLPAKKGETVNEFTCEIDRKLTGNFILIHVEDNSGQHAMTRAFYKGEDY